MLAGAFGLESDDPEPFDEPESLDAPASLVELDDEPPDSEVELDESFDDVDAVVVALEPFDRLSVR